jgi:hypothetical protein
MTLEEAKREVERLEQQGPLPIDGRIKPLVIGLWRWQVKTTNSCQGHKDEGWQYPWVRIRLGDAGKATVILAEWHYRSDRKPLQWVIEPAWEPKIRPAETDQDLEFLQKEAISLGKWLQKLPQDFVWFNGD